MRIILCVLVTLFLCSTTYAEQVDEMPLGNVPTKINADTMDYIADEDMIIFTGDVFIEREEFDLWADIVTIYLKSDEAELSEEATQNNEENNEASVPLSGLQDGDIDRIVAENNVRFQYNTNTGSAERAIYEADLALLTMQVNPILKDGDNTITGEEIRYYLNENRSEVIGGTSRVEAIFSSE